MPVSHALMPDSPVAVVTIDRPERKGALDHDHLEQLDAAVGACLEAGARVLVLTGTDGGFCAGADLKELEDVTFTERLAEVLTRLATLPLVTVAAIDGPAMGLGMQLALACASRDEVDELVAKAIAAGGSAPRPAQDHGFMYAHGFDDVDGHIWEVFYMDPSAHA